MKRIDRNTSKANCESSHNASMHVHTVPEVGRLTYQEPFLQELRLGSCLVQSGEHGVGSQARWCLPYHDLERKRIGTSDQ